MVRFQHHDCTAQADFASRGPDRMRILHENQIATHISGQNVASSNKAMPNSSYCWAYTNIGPHSSFLAKTVCLDAYGRMQHKQR